MIDIDPNDEDKAFQRIVRMLNASEQSSAKVRDKLARVGYGEETVDRAVSRAESCGIIDDARYAEMLVRSALSQNRGLRPVSAELDDLGISLDDVEAYREQKARCEQDPSSSDIARAISLLDAHPPRAKNLRAAAFRKLMSKGYDIDIATDAAQRWCDDHRS